MTGALLWTSLIILVDDQTKGCFSIYERNATKARELYFLQCRNFNISQISISDNGAACQSSCCESIDNNNESSTFDIECTNSLFELGTLRQYNDARRAEIGPGLNNIFYFCVEDKISCIDLRCMLFFCAPASSLSLRPCDITMHAHRDRSRVKQHLPPLCQGHNNIALTYIACYQVISSWCSFIRW